MVFKITGTVISVREAEHAGDVEIKFVGGVVGGKKVNEPCTLLVQSMLLAKEHILRQSITLAGESGEQNRTLIFFGGEHGRLAITKEVTLDMTARLTPKRKGGGKQSVDAEVKSAFNSLKSKDLFISVNLKSDNVLSDKTLKGTHIEIVFHE